MLSEGRSSDRMTGWTGSFGQGRHPIDPNPAWGESTTMHPEELRERTIGCAYATRKRGGQTWPESVDENRLLTELCSRGRRAESHGPIRIHEDGEGIRDFVVLPGWAGFVLNRVEQKVEEQPKAKQLMEGSTGFGESRPSCYLVQKRCDRIYESEH
jgi:hypothetical protein